ncbi:MAG TPA: hypothetical protein VGD65_19240 [Chryseosolibacter sp.]
MEILTTIYVALIEAMKSFVPVGARRTGENSFLIVESKLYDPDDNSSLFEFIPGDTVEVQRQFRKNHMGLNEEVLVATRLLNSKVQGRNLYTLMFLISDQNQILSASQLVQYETEIRELRKNV